MRTLIVYYSRTGTTRRLATALAGALDAELAEIHCARYRRGWFRYLLAGYDSVKGNLPPIEVPSVAFGDYDLVLIGAPVWTSHPALPIRAFLAGAPALPARTALFLTYGGHSPAETAVAELTAVLPSPAEADLCLRSDEVGGNSDRLDAFLEALKPGGKSDAERT